MNGGALRLPRAGITPPGFCLPPIKKHPNQLDKEIKWEIERDAMLVEDGWDLTWVFEDATASKPLIQELVGDVM